MKCIICGKEFTPTNRGGMKKIVCSPECKKQRIRDLNRQNYKLNKEERDRHSADYALRKRIEKRMPKSTAAQLTQLQREAWEHGMSYGNYVAMTERRGRT